MTLERYPCLKESEGGIAVATEERIVPPGRTPRGYEHKSTYERLRLFHPEGTREPVILEWKRGDGGPRRWECKGQVCSPWNGRPSRAPCSGRAASPSRGLGRTRLACTTSMGTLQPVVCVDRDQLAMIGWLGPGLAARAPLKWGY